MDSQTVVRECSQFSDSQKNQILEFLAGLPKSHNPRNSALRANTSIASIKSSVSKRRVVFFLTAYAGKTPSIEYASLAFRRLRNTETVGIYLQSHPPSGIYDHTIYCDGAIEILLKILKAYPDVPVYIQAHHRWIFLPVILMEAFPHRVFVTDVNDWAFDYFDENAKAFAALGVISEAEVDLILTAEKALRNSRSLILHKNLTAPGAEFPNQDTHHLYLPCPPKESFQVRQGKAGGAPKLVYAGQIAGYRQEQRVYGDMNLLELFRDLCSQGFQVDVYTPVFQDHRVFFEMYEEYLEEAKTSELFKFRQGFNWQQLLPILARNQYDYGVILFRQRDNFIVGDRHVRNCMATKLFTYLAADIPVIVSSEFSYMSDFVRNHGIGVAVSQSGLRNLRRALPDDPELELRPRVSRVRFDFQLGPQLEAVMSRLDI